jgi:hypothetical protein
MDNNGRDHDLLISLNTKMDVILNEMEKYVTKQEFAPVKAIVYGAVTIALAGIITAILGYVLKN